MIIQTLKDLKADLWVFDNDGTLYSNPSDLEKAVGALMIECIASFYGISNEKAKKKRSRLLNRYNTEYTLIALRQEGIMEDDFIQRTYLSVNPADFGIMPSSELKDLIGSLSGEKIVLTNNPSEFAELILDALGIKHLFSKVIGMRERNYVQKPKEEAFGVALDAISAGRSVAVLDDEIENIRVAKQLGCATILVNSQEASKYSDFNLQLP